MEESKVHLKLLIDTKNKRVLFAEAGKDFVDFIFHILAMPLATAIRLLGQEQGDILETKGTKSDYFCAFSIAH
ncbi:Hypothetical predicted protein [Olea europaea subsp. europaea]|uniref:Uncharacterized protein n=1 Tax=Olea europaea subsp. europaea TaxID=158383 RepID=A0A8S0SS76_OLEEU|nr:Hypothetical predicted protein [Olea europaea subsp. europaea]